MTQSADQQDNFSGNRGALVTGERDFTETVYTWSRDKVSSCNCSEKYCRHVHCPCLRCQGNATSRSTELRHWSKSRLLSEGASSLTTFEVGSDSGGGSGDELTIMDFDAEESFSEEQPRADIIVKQSSVSESEDMDVFEEPVSKEDNVNPLRQIIVKAVLDALNIMESSGASVKTFEDIPDYAQQMEVLGLLNSEVTQAENDIQTMELSHWESEHFSDDSDELNVELPEFDIHF